MVIMVHMMSWVVVTVVARIGIMCVRRVVAMRVGRVGQRRVPAVAFPAGARAVLPVSAVLAVVATIHDSRTPYAPGSALAAIVSTHTRHSAHCHITMLLRLLLPLYLFKTFRKYIKCMMTFGFFLQRPGPTAL